LKEGFYYDQYIGELKVREEDYAKIEDIADKIAKEKQPYQRVILSKQEALEMFRTNPFKV
jgi:threonyl-tRNA synthetase